MDRITVSPAEKQLARMMSSAHATPEKKRGPIAALIAVLVALAILGVFLTGCTVQYGLDTTVEEDGSGTVGIRLAADKELQDALSSATDSLGGLGDLGDLGGLGDLGDLGMLGSILGGLGDTGILGELGTLGKILEAMGALNDLTGELPTSVDELFNLILGQIPGDWQVERGTDSEGTSWVNLTRSFSDLEELEQIMSESVIASMVPLDEFYIHQDEGFFGTKTVFSTSLNPEEAITGAQGDSSSLPADLLEKVLAIQNRLTLPGEIKDNNADQVDGNTLIWNIGLSGKTDMYAESVVRNWGAIIGVTVGGIIVLALIVLAVVLLLRRRGRSVPPSQPTEAEPGTATAQVVGQGDGTQVPSESPDNTASTALTDTTEVRPPSPVVPPPLDDAPPQTAVESSTATAGVAAGAAIAATADGAAGEGGASSDEGNVDQASGDRANTDVGTARSATADVGAADSGNTDGGTTGPASTAEATAGESPPTLSEEQAATDYSVAAEEAAATDQVVQSEAPPQPAPRASEGGRPRPPTPIPLRPSRTPTQSSDGRADHDGTSTPEGGPS